MRVTFCPESTHTHPKRRFYQRKDITHAHRACSLHVWMWWFHAHCQGHGALRLIDVA